MELGDQERGYCIRPGERGRSLRPTVVALERSGQTKTVWGRCSRTDRWLNVVGLDGVVLEDGVKAVLLGNLWCFCFVFCTLDRIDVTLLGKEYSMN